VDGLGVNWGTQSTHPLPPDVVVRLLRANGFQKVKLFDADSAALNALSGSGIEVMVGIPNDMLAGLAAGVSAAEKWVAQNVSSYVSSNSVDIRYVAVGNEPFLSTLNGTYESVTLPAMQNIQAALIRAGLGGRIKVTVPLNADVYQSSTQLPSSGDFRPDIHGLMLQIVAFLTANASPFTVNIYPFISLYDDPNFPSAYAFFDDGYAYPIVDGGRTYANVFDANHDTLVWALQNNGFDNVTIVVGEIGWPTDGNVDADPGNAERFNQGFVGHAAAGTPMRPGPIDAYLFSLVDEDAKSIRPGNFERHWGLFYYDGGVKYNLTLNPNSPSGQLAAATGVEYLPRRWCVMSPSASPTDPQLAPSVSYACAMADCTSLGYGTSCGFLNAAGNVSYAFNSYYQINDQLGSACRFPDGLSVVTDVDPSVGTCRFDVMIR
ncbi:hypothetical protein M569_08338, partial [Genlisea aurea]